MGYEINLDSTTYIEEMSLTRDNTMATITINPRDRDCAAITCRSKVTLQGVSSNHSTAVGSYNVVEKLNKTPTQISLFQLLCISPNHKDILDKALQDSVLARDK